MGRFKLGYLYVREVNARNNTVVNEIRLVTGDGCEVTCLSRTKNEHEQNATESGTEMSLRRSLQEYI